MVNRLLHPPGFSAVFWRSGKTKKTKKRKGKEKWKYERLYFFRWGQNTQINLYDLGMRWHFLFCLVFFFSFCWCCCFEIFKFQDFQVKMPGFFSPVKHASTRILNPAVSLSVRLKICIRAGLICFPIIRTNFTSSDLKNRDLVVSAETGYVSA